MLLSMLSLFREKLEKTVRDSHNVQTVLLCNGQHKGFILKLTTVIALPARRLLENC